MSKSLDAATRAELARTAEAFDEAERGILTRWAEKMVGGYADFPTPDKKQHARTILRYEATIAALLAAAERGAEATAKAQREGWLAAKRGDCPSFQQTGHCKICETTAYALYPDPNDAAAASWSAARSANPTETVEDKS